jgi:hypothetical protein
MWGLRRQIKDELVLTTSDLVARIQRLENEQAEIRAWLERERQLRVFTANLAAAAQIAPAVGAAIERFAEAMRAPLPRGRAGGVARARTAWRYFDGTFMPESAKLEARIAEYERYAAGGRTRSAYAQRAPDGTFVRSETQEQK